MNFKVAAVFLIILFPAMLFGQPKTYLCMHPAQEINIDGELAEWEQTPRTDEFIDISGNNDLKPWLRTHAMMMWDSNYLYIAAEMEEPHLWATIAERDKVIFYDNDFEVFIDPDGDTHNYAEIEINAMGTEWDLFLTRPYRDGTTPLTSYDIHGMKTAVQLHGSLNDPSDTDEGWTLEMAIPWKSLEELTPGKRKPYPGEHYRINFSRVQWDLDTIRGSYRKTTDPENGKANPEHNWVWSPQGKVNMHMPEKWGYVFFSEKRPGEDAAQPGVPNEEHYRSELRELYYKQKKYFSEYRHYTNDPAILYPHTLIPDSFEVSVSEQQYTISLYAPESRSTWYINHKGRIWNKKHIRTWVWMHGNDQLSEAEWKKRFSDLASYGIDGVLLGGRPELLKKVIPLANEEGVEIQAWRWMLNCNNKEVIESHPEWYSVSREGYSCLEKQPYVGYYKWLCPSRTEVRDYLDSIVYETLAIEGLAGFHMDYIRYPDVILPRALWEKYGLVQDHEMPEYDFCYCDVCRTRFKEEHGYDPLELKHPDNDSLWRQYRYDMVTEVVMNLSETISYREKKLSAAVFPGPGIARKLVRQDWDQWTLLSEVFPMIYHNFYNEDLKWIGEVTWEGVHALNDRIPLYTGLYVPALSPEELDKAIRIAIDAGASGVSLFEYGSMSEDHWKIFQQRIRTHK